MKNLVLLHLESLNMMTYRMNPDLFPVIRRMEESCRVFEQYYSTATSTLMVVGDLLYGGMEQYEGCNSLDAIPGDYLYSASLFDDLKQQGYETGIYIYPEGGDRESAERRHIAGFHHKMELIRSYPEYVNMLEQKMDCPPFALMICNYISNISLNCYVDINEYGLDTDFWEAGYRCMDRCCGDVLRLLKQKSLLDDTVIIMYGDHGDDYWGHGMHCGLTHAIEPNNLLIHTPLMIWDGVRREKAEHDRRVMQTTDLRPLIMQMLEPEEKGDWQSERKYAFSRNEYAAQPLREDSFNKAYSVTDGRYMLMVSGKGLEMYDTKMDPACQNNVLRFFYFLDGVLKENKKCVDEYRFHFSSYWSGRQQRILRQKFYELLQVLQAKVLGLYLAGNLGKETMLDEMGFEKIADDAFV